MRKNLLTMDVILAKEIIYMLKNEGYHPGDRLPSERFLAEHFHVQRPTIRNALAQLVREHYLFPRKDLDILLLRIESKYLLTPVLIILIPEKDVRIFAGSLILLKKF